MYELKTVMLKKKQACHIKTSKKKHIVLYLRYSITDRCVM